MMSADSVGVYKLLVLLSFSVLVSAVRSAESPQAMHTVELQDAYLPFYPVSGGDAPLQNLHSLGLSREPIEQPSLPAPRLLGLKTAILGLLLIFLTFLMENILTSAPRDSRAFTTLDWTLSTLDKALPEEWSAMNGVYVREFIPFFAILLSASGISSLVTSILQQRRGLRNASQPPPVRGVDFIAIGLISIMMLLCEMAHPQILTVAVPSLLVGTGLAIFSRRERRKFFERLQLKDKKSAPIEISDWGQRVDAVPSWDYV